MDPNNQPPQEDKALRRSCLKFAIFAVAGMLMVAAVVALAVWALQPPEDTPVAVFVLRPLLMIGVTLGGMALTMYLFSWAMRDVKKIYDRSGEVLQRTLPDLPIERESKAGDPSVSTKQMMRLAFLLPLYFLSASALIWATREGLKLIWADAPGWAQQGIALVALISVSLGVRKILLSRQQKQGKAPATTFKEDIGRIARSMLFFVLFMPPLFWLIRQITALDINPILMAPVGLIGATAGFSVLLLAYMGIPLLWIMAAAEKGNYDRALWRVRIAENLSTSRGMYLSLHGELLFRAGRYIEAEQVLRTGIVEERKEGAGGVDILNTLGYALMGQGRYEEAVAIFEGALTAHSGKGTAHDSLAEAYLFQGIETEWALELLDQALTQKQSSWLNRRLSRRTIGEMWAGRAWALARLGRRSEANEALERALEIAPRKGRADFASILYRAGHALALLEETQKAAETFAEAQRIDPEGHYGHLCAEAAAELRKGNPPSGDNLNG